MNRLRSLLPQTDLTAISENMDHQNLNQLQSRWTALFSSISSASIDKEACLSLTKGMNVILFFLLRLLQPVFEAQFTKSQGALVGSLVGAYTVTNPFLSQQTLSDF